jgi:hypothetical protein
MGRAAGIAAAFLLLVGVVAQVSVAGSARPTVGTCLRAWNAPANATGRAHVVALGSVGASLRPGSAGTDSWTKDGRARSTQFQACLLTLTRPGSERTVTGRWSGAAVVRWTFGPSIIGTTSGAPPANVRMRVDGRLSLI